MKGGRGSSKKKPTSKSAKAGLTFPVARIGRALRTMRLAMPELYEKTGPTKRAGQEHQAWRGIERVALKRGLVPEARADEERDDADAEEGGAA